MLTLLWLLGDMLFVLGAGPLLFAWWWHDGRHLPQRRRQAVLDALAFGEELHGLTIVERSRGLLSRGRVYVLLDRLEDEGLIKSRLEPRKPTEAFETASLVGAARPLQRRLYRLAEPRHAG